MRSYYLLAFVVLSVTFLVSSCGNTESDNVRSQARQTLPPPSPNALANTPPAPTSAFNAAQPHYVCPNNCAGGNGPAAGNCPVCGTTMSHNQAYHNAAATTTPPTIDMNAPQAPATAFNANEPHYKCPNNCAGGTGPGAGNCPVCGTTMAHNQAYHNAGGATTASPIPADASSLFNAPQTNTTAPTPAQNAAGVFHYTCGNGCAGGAGSAGTCATCGGTLAHNQAYHGN